MKHATNSFREATAGLWRNNVALAQLLGLCPLLAVSTSLVNGLALGVMTTAVLVVANTAMSLMRRVLLPAVRVPLYLLLLAALVTSLDLLTHAMFYDLHEVLGLFVPLIVVNCGLLAHAETVASRRPVGFVALSAVAMGFGFMFVLMVLGGARELLGHGTLLAGIEMLTRRSRHGAQRRSAIRRHARCDSPAGRLFRHGAAARATQPFDDGRGDRRGAGRAGASRGAAVNAARRRKIYERFARANPAPATELVYTTPFELLVAVVLSAQATDVSVNKATAKLFPVANTPSALLELGEEGLKSYIKTIGLFNSKAKNLMKTCAALVAEHAGEVPRDRDALEALPGVGRKTANVILNTAFGEATIAVDTHIFRVANRIGLAPGANVRAVEDELVRVTPDEFKRHAHHWLILHGRYVCKARKPSCPTCLIADLCEYPDKTSA